MDGYKTGKIGEACRERYNRVRVKFRLIFSIFGFFMALFSPMHNNMHIRFAEVPAGLFSSQIEHTSVPTELRALNEIIRILKVSRGFSLSYAYNNH